MSDRGEEDLLYNTQPSDSQDKAIYEELKLKLGHKDKDSFQQGRLVSTTVTPRNLTTFVADEPFETVKDLIYNYAKDKHVRVTFARLMKKRMNYNHQDTYTVQVNMVFDDYDNNVAGSHEQDRLLSRRDEARLMFQNKMLILLKLCVSVWVLVLDAGAQVDICGSESVLVANSTPQTLQNTDGFSSQCTVQITVPAGSSLKLNFTRLSVTELDIELFANDSSANSPSFADVIKNAEDGRSAPIYVYHGSVYIRVYFHSTISTFVMTYQEVDFEENICTLPSLVFADTTVQEVVTPNFRNGPYFDNVDCEVVIESNITGAREVKVEVTSFDMECCCDDVRICDDDGCLSLCYTSKRIFRGSNVTIRHWSDYSLGFNGMRLEYTVDFTDWTPWKSNACYRDCTTKQRLVDDTRTRACLKDSCMGETNQKRTRVCRTTCKDCVLGN
ncbi:uncharacterized protein LOC124145157 [Haliotis rufescens]|uniref:uncharacterized protein LOC124145157 n=1 Tax=Haliotis rufescens TaxID=6454 RepID=UPI00201F1A2B|nr:uncharacterized protein LOC124145157 [Haliotis rufescens]